MTRTADEALADSVAPFALNAKLALPHHLGRRGACVVTADKKAA